MFAKTGNSFQKPWSARTVVAQVVRVGRASECAPRFSVGNGRLKVRFRRSNFAVPEHSKSAGITQLKQVPDLTLLENPNPADRRRKHDQSSHARTQPTCRNRPIGRGQRIPQGCLATTQSQRVLERRR